MWPFNPKLYPYYVTVLFDGRHPYVTGKRGKKLSYPSSEETFIVQAKNWGDVSKRAYTYIISNPKQFPQWWKISVIAIRVG